VHQATESVGIEPTTIVLTELVRKAFITLHKEPLVAAGRLVGR
jgi:hypothetical protein